MFVEQYSWIVENKAMVYAQSHWHGRFIVKNGTPNDLPRGCCLPALA
jgi:hypothetical protein